MDSKTLEEKSIASSPRVSSLLAAEESLSDAEDQLSDWDNHSVSQKYERDTLSADLAPLPQLSTIPFKHSPMKTQLTVAIPSSPRTPPQSPLSPQKRRTKYNSPDLSNKVQMQNRFQSPRRMNSPKTNLNNNSETPIPSLSPKVNGDTSSELEIELEQADHRMVEVLLKLPPDKLEGTIQSLEEKEMVLTAREAKELERGKILNILGNNLFNSGGFNSPQKLSSILTSSNILATPSPPKFTSPIPQRQAPIPSPLKLSPTSLNIPTPRKELNFNEMDDMILDKSLT